MLVAIETGVAGAITNSEIKWELLCKVGRYVLMWLHRRAFAVGYSIYWIDSPNGGIYIFGMAHQVGSAYTTYIDRLGF